MEGPHGGRPHWSVTWLFRIQRTGRDRHERDIDAGEYHERRWGRVIVYIALGAIALIEIGVGVWLGVLPR